MTLDELINFLNTHKAFIQKHYKDSKIIGITTNGSFVAIYFPNGECNITVIDNEG